MKLNKWLYGVTALAMLAACSDKDITSGGGNENGGNKFSEGTSYLGVSLELPTEPISRADDGDQGNDNFADGTATEYNVDNAAILLFWGEKEDDAKFVGAYTLGEDEVWDSPDGDNITTSFHRTIQVLNKPILKDATDKSKLWGLALVNYKDKDNDIHFNIEKEIEDKNKYGDLTIYPKYKLEESGITTIANPTGGIKLNRLKDDEAAATTFSEFRSYITDCKFLNYRDASKTSLKSIFMTNAPLSNVKGTDVASVTNPTIQTLAELDHSQFKNTKIDAQDNPAGCIFVERAVAKITCSKFPASTKLSRAVVDTDGKISTQDVTLKIASVEWLVDNDEETSFIVRNTQETHDWWQHSSTNSFAQVDPKTRFRFIGGVSMTDKPSYHDGQAYTHNWFRTYWCIDPAYNIDKKYIDNANAATPAYADFAPSNDGTNDIWISKNALYPHENTFNVAHQQYKNTTRVVFKVQYDSNSEYTDASGNTKKVGSLFAVKGELKNFYLRDDADNILKRAVVGSNEIPEIIRKFKKAGVDVPNNVNCYEWDIQVAAADIKDDDDKIIAKKGTLYHRTLKFTDTFINTYLEFNVENTKEELQIELNEVMDGANDSNEIVMFDNNVCYYVVYIQHFGDTYCKLPVKDTKDENGNEIPNWSGDRVDKVYGVVKDATDESAAVAAMYLGRYGLVRNNWYDINVSKIGRLGNVNVPSGNEEDSDDNNVEEWFLSARVHILSWAKRTQKVIF